MSLAEDKPKTCLTPYILAFVNIQFDLNLIIGPFVAIIAWKALGRDCTNNNGLILEIGVYHPKL